MLSKTLVKATKQVRTKRHKEVQEAKKSLIEELTLKYRIEFIAVEKFLELRHSEAKREPKRESKEADKEVVRKQRLAAIGERVLQAKKDGIADKLLLLAQQGSVSDSEDSD